MVYHVRHSSSRRGSLHDLRKSKSMGPKGFISHLGQLAGNLIPLATILSPRTGNKDQRKSLSSEKISSSHEPFGFFKDDEEIGLPNEDQRLLQDTILYLKTRDPTHSLQLSKGLVEAAKEHANDLGQQTDMTKVLSHTGRNGKGFLERLSAKGDWTTCIGENIFKATWSDQTGSGKSKAEEAEDHLMNLLIEGPDPTHFDNLENLMSSRFTYIGMGSSTHIIDGTIAVLNFAGDFGPPVEKARPSKFNRFKEAQGSMSDDMQLLLNTVPFLELREIVRNSSQDPSLIVVLEATETDCTANIIENGVTKVLTGSWKLNCQEHRVWYDKKAEIFDEESEYEWEISDCDEEADASETESDLDRTISFWIKPSGHSLSFRRTKTLCKAAYS